MNPTRHEGGCLCGHVRFRTAATPVRVMACHCTTCKKRTGSAFGVGVYFNEAEVEIHAGKCTTYRYCSDTSGRWLQNEFCARCGTTVSWTLEMRPGLRAIAGGSYDDPGWFTIEHHIWTRSACNGICYPDGVSVRSGALPG